MNLTPSSYSTDVEGGAIVGLRYAIEGRMRVADYLAFIAERAHWFGISGWVAATGARSVTLVATGPEAMVGALEMACTLGPLNALIERIDSVEERAPIAAGFEVRG
jgi:acylphosphatase